MWLKILIIKKTLIIININRFKINNLILDISENIKSLKNKK